jgi:CheY-like chemotaxis protein
MDPSTLRVLVVDDNPACVRAAASLLSPYGYDVTVALSGEDALEQAARLAPDVVLLDMAMPGIDGYEVAARLPGVTRGKPPFIVAVTGCGEEEARARAFAAGVNMHLVKPVKPGTLLHILGQFRVLLGMD